MTTLVTEETQPEKDGKVGPISIISWEQACEESQQWAYQARRKAHYRRLRHRALIILLFLFALAIIAIAVIFVTDGSI